MASVVADSAADLNQPTFLCFRMNNWGSWHGCVQKAKQLEIKIIQPRQTIDFLCIVDNHWHFWWIVMIIVMVRFDMGQFEIAMIKFLYSMVLDFFVGGTAYDLAVLYWPYHCCQSVGLFILWNKGCFRSRCCSRVALNWCRTDYVWYIPSDSNFWLQMFPCAHC